MKIIAILLLPFISSSLFSLAQSPSERHIQQIDSLVTSVYNGGHFSGAVLVASGQSIIYQKALGLANREWNTLNSVDTKYRIASITKSLTATLTLKLVQNGKLQLEDKVTDYLKDYPNRTGSLIAIHHLLSHTSGLIDYPDIPNFEWNLERLKHSRGDMLGYFKDRELLFEPGTDYRYSNLGYYLLTLILEEVSGQSYSQLLNEQICQPLGMQNTSVLSNRIVMEKRANGYANTQDGIINAPPFDQSIVMGAGDIISTVHDLYLFDQGLYNDSFLSSTYKEKMFTPSMPEKDNYAYGWYVKLPDKHEGPHWMRHSGSINGFSSLLLRLTDERHTIIILANMHGIKTIEIGDKIKGILYSQK